ncbi:uncharacterized protein LOC111698940 isoform X2 [Eurytemora carolleeae]|uniref:uncharacterized protein LOC111698940 isoform X2 n=1 Tax=Eurytemora carolleeae TaxID=1294199 RepID=UPI000C78EF11|nr:uncharacterized protein LOC111698940 isoform X2 [Eurytemora carolleeae]|eukprot:XP_023325195.1 uncharacterized protein LOC111698940 isoform X2 [Eurytemora affinis]
MSNSGDILDLSGNLAKMSVATTKVEKNYMLNLKIGYTKCFSCRYDIGFSKDALVCNCSLHWYCSTQCRDQCKDEHCLESHELINCTSLDSFYSKILHYYDMETLNMVKEYISSQEGVSREDMKKLAEAGDWKAALIIGLTYEFRFVLDWDECELALLPPFMKSRPFSHRKAIKYYNMAAEENSVEVFASIGRILLILEDMRRAGKDYLMKSSNRFKSSQNFLYLYCFPDLGITLSYIKEEYKQGEELNVPVYGITGVILFRLNLLDDSRSSDSLLKELLFFPKISEVYSSLKNCNPEPRIVCDSVNNSIPGDSFRPVENPFFIQKADLYNEEDSIVARIDPGVRMDAKAVYDQGYFQRLHHNQPIYYCEHDVANIGNTCTQCAQLAQERILSVYENSFLFSKDECMRTKFYSIIFTLESGLKKQDHFWIYGKYEIITAIRVMALQPMDLHPLQLAKDLTIYWPIVYYYGSVYSALKEILDGKTVDRIYENIPEFTPLPERRNIVDEEQFVIKCGHNSCVYLDWEFKFKQCTRGKLRRYCSPSCQKLDWKVHKKECFLRPGMENTDNEVD